MKTLFRSFYNAPEKVVLFAIIAILAVPSTVYAHELPTERTPVSVSPRFAPMNMRRLILNRQGQGGLLVQEVKQDGETVLMVPLRTIMELIGWKVVFQEQPEYGQAKAQTPHASVTAPYHLPVDGEVRPSELHKKPSPGFSLSLTTGDTRLFSPEWNMDETMESKPLPKVVDGQVYVSLDYLDEVMMRLVGRLQETVDDSDENSVVSPYGVSIQYESKESTINVRYKDPARLANPEH